MTLDVGLHLRETYDSLPLEIEGGKNGMPLAGFHLGVALPLVINHEQLIVKQGHLTHSLSKSRIFTDVVGRVFGYISFTDQPHVSVVVTVHHQSGPIGFEQ